jgi:hypothetical protein
MTGDYTFVSPERQNELTRRIQQKLSDAGQEPSEKRRRLVEPPMDAPDLPPSLADTKPVTPIVQ